MLNLGLLKPEHLAIWDTLDDAEKAQVYALIGDDSGLSRYCPQEPTTKQWEFINQNDLEVFFGGSAGPGKSSGLLMAALQYVDEPHYSAILFRRTYADLSLPGAIMDRALSWLKGKPGVHWNPTDKRFTFPSGATLQFGYLDTDLDRYRYQSSEFQFCGFDELSQFTERQYLYLFSRLRKLKGSRIPLRMRSASNPGGVGGQWVYERFVDPNRSDTSRIFIPARLRDNPHLDQVAYIQSLGQLDDVTKAQLLEGDWHITERGNVFPMWSDGEHGHHVITWSQFEVLYGIRKIPSNWQMAIGLDWGSTKNHPAIVSWVARAAEGFPLEGSFFLFREQMHVGALVDDIAEEIQDWLDKDQAAHRVRLWRMSHEARSERDTFRRKYGLPFQPMKQGKTDGIAQMRYLLRLQELDQPHAFKPWIKGTPRLFLVVDDSEIRMPSSASGLQRHRGEFGAYRYTEPEISQQRGQALPVPFKLFDDAMDACRGVFSEWGPAVEARTDAEIFEASFPAVFRQPPPPTVSTDERNMWSLACWIATGKAKDKQKERDKLHRGYDDEAEAERDYERMLASEEAGEFPSPFARQRPIDY